jgi:hypothetical protein
MKDVHGNFLKDLEKEILLTNPKIGVGKFLFYYSFFKSYEKF